ncbi:MAG: thioredoxin family protein [Gammaproteobacteria bacterium]|nr:thioredoxin family protein [Gammaproteobacteria bacterium]
MHRVNDIIFDVNFEEFDQQVIAASKQRPILVDLWADWCPPCVVITPVLEKLVSERGGEIALAKIEVDEGLNMKIAGRYQARGFPTILLFFQGELKGRFHGAKSQSFIEQFIDESLS